MFTKDYKARPYWRERSPPPANEATPLPTKVDVLIIGAGYTGLHAALQTARAARNTLVLDSEHAGRGASARNGGQISTSIKPAFAELKNKYGREMAFAIHREGRHSLEYIKSFIKAEGIDCDFAVTGRFHAAHNPARYERLARTVAQQIPGLEDEAFMIPRAEQRSELGTDHYFGGAVFPKHASLDPAAYHKGLLAKAQAAGATILSYCPALNINRDKAGFSVRTPAGTVKTGRVVIATNGYTGALTPRLQRRIIPIGSYMIATEPLAKDLIDRLLPTNRIISDTRRVVYYYRPSPDRSRILFGGRVSLRESNPRATGPKLRAALARIFPELKTVKISHSWMGYIAFTFDRLMHIGEDDGLYYAMGYCGAGVGMASYLGMKLGQQVIGLKAGQTAFNTLPFPTRPCYTGKPWFLAPAVLYYRLVDRLNI